MDKRDEQQQTIHELAIKSYELHSEMSVCVFMLSRFHCVRLFVTPWTVDHQAPLSMGFSRQEYWSGLHFLL